MCLLIFHCKTKAPFQQPFLSFTGPPKLVVTPTKLTLLDPFHRGMSQSNGDVGRPPHYAKTRAPAISSLSQPRNGHLSVSVAPSWSESPSAPARKMGVASLLFHRTLSPKDTLQVHSYTLEKQQQPHTQLQVHSYAREHQPRHLQHKTCTPSHTQVQPLFQTPSCEVKEPRPETKNVISKGALNGSVTQRLVAQDQKEEKPKVAPSPAPAIEKKPEVEPNKPTFSSQTETQQVEMRKAETETTKNNKRKVCFYLFHNK